MSFLSIKDFREKATPEDMKALEEYILSQRKKTKAFPCEKYHFSYTSASKELRNHGFLGGIRSTSKETKNEEFIIKSGESKKCTSRSFSVQDNILERIDKLSCNNCQYSKKAIINQLLDDALKKYGY